jgi:hypothetical protein
VAGLPEADAFAALVEVRGDPRAPTAIEPCAAAKSG